MRAFLIAVAAAVMIALAGGFMLSKMQEPVSVAYSTNAVRL